jgi:hypothetical protein
MATNNILSIPQWILTGSVSQPESGFSKIYPKKGETSSWYIVDEANSEKRLALDYYIGAGLSQSLLPIDSKWGYRLDVAIGPGLTYASGPVLNAPISVAGLTPSMLSITGSFVTGYILTTSTYSGEFLWVPNVNAQLAGDVNKLARFTGPFSLTSSLITDTGQYVYVGSFTPSNTFASFSVDGYANIGVSGTGSRLYFGDSQNHFIEKESNGGFIIRTEDEFRVDHFTLSSNTYKVINFDYLGDENRTLGLMNNLVEIINYTYSSYISASNVNFVRFGKPTNAFQLELISGSQGAIKIQDGGQATFSVLYSDSQGIGRWGQIFGYNGLTTSSLGIGLNLVNMQGLTLSGGTFGIDYSKFGLPLQVYDTFTISLATVSVETGFTYGSAFETPTFRLDQWGRVIGIATVSTRAFTGPQGPTGFSFVWSGSYATSSTYSFYNVVEYDGSSYISLGTSSPGLTPSTSTQSWSLMASRGLTGSQGATGTSFTWRGNFGTSSTYDLYNVVYYGGSSYISITTSNMGMTPSTATQSWDLMVLGSTASGSMDLIAGTFGDIMVYSNYGWTALGLGPSGSYLYSLGTESNSLPIWVTASPASNKITQNYKVNLPEGKYFGKYAAGADILSNGWTFEYFIFDVLNQNMAPTVQLIVTDPVSKTIAFGTVNISITLNFNYTITNILPTGVPATFSSARLDWSTNDVDWTNLWTTNSPKEELDPSTNPAKPYTFTHTQDEGYDGFYYFRLQVTDTAGLTGIDKDQVDVTDFQNPIFTLQISGQSLISDYGETPLLRELGNVLSNITGSVTRQSPLIDLVSWQLRFYHNTDSTEVQLYGGSFAQPEGGSIGTVQHTKNTPGSDDQLINRNSLTYKLYATDERGVPVGVRSSSPVTVQFEPLIFCGPVDDTSWRNGDLNTITRTTLLGFRSAQSRFRIKLQSVIESGGKFTFDLGVTFRTYLIVVPSTLTVTNITKYNESGSPSSDYTFQLQSPVTNTIATADAGRLQSYKIYRFSVGGAFTSEDGYESYMEVTVS